MSQLLRAFPVPAELGTSLENVTTGLQSISEHLPDRGTTLGVRRPGFPLHSYVALNGSVSFLSSVSFCVLGVGVGGGGRVGER